MRREGLTVTMIFLAESANYGEGVGNITTLKKMSRGNYEQYSYISRQALRYNIVSQLSWDNTPVDEKSGVVQFAPSATIKEYPEIDLFGYMKTTKEGDQKGGAAFSPGDAGGYACRSDSGRHSAKPENRAGDAGGYCREGQRCGA